jgi:hypothetical protein
LRQGFSSNSDDKIAGLEKQFQASSLLLEATAPEMWLGLAAK